MNICQKLASNDVLLSLSAKGALLVDAPRVTLTNDLLALIRDNKEKIIQELKENFFQGAYFLGTNGQIPKATQAGKIFVPALNGTNEGQTELALSCFQQRAQVANSLTELHKCLEDFSGQRWGLLQRADMSASYTPHALWMIEQESADKWVLLEDLGQLCWNPYNPQVAT
jgi:hypothetical protein